VGGTTVKLASGNRTIYISGVCYIGVLCFREIVSAVDKMKIVDIIFLCLVVLCVVVMLISSKLMRVIVWESLRHPFTHSKIEIRGKRVRVWRGKNMGG
jgi:hypothetical protein